MEGELAKKLDVRTFLAASSATAAAAAAGALPLPGVGHVPQAQAPTTAAQLQARVAALRPASPAHHARADAGGARGHEAGSGTGAAPGSRAAAGPAGGTAVGGTGAGGAFGSNLDNAVARLQDRLKARGRAGPGAGAGLLG